MTAAQPRRLSAAQVIALRLAPTALAAEVRAAQMLAIVTFGRAAAGGSVAAAAAANARYERACARLSELYLDCAPSAYAPTARGGAA
jgi:hypothetical protein